ncbi:hypothetical protein CTAYLR_003782 [Chrysophaeum taylorii]|uniref:Peptidase M48 domain-containing protein n=1 Tax=Chrysophaeum taylorii TaxID=2483200 RepID=A0AAD7XLM1_9STRA|nr:hypothetical protein CTAYLR_003782 [Chrysophaeum taylorii]
MTLGRSVGLNPNAFRHPLDSDLTRLVRGTTGGLEGLVRLGVRSLVEPFSRLENLAFGVRVSDCHLHSLLVEACDTLDVRVPELYVRQDPLPNAYTLAFRGETSIVATSALVSLLSDDELRAVFGHELGHIKCEHSVWLSVAGIAWPNVPVFGQTILSPLLADWRRAAEYTCDRAALLVVKDPKIVTSALLKLLSGLEDPPDPATFLSQARDYENTLRGANPLVRSLFASQKLSRLTHPLPLQRVAELDKWGASSAYAAALARIK